MIPPNAEVQIRAQLSLIQTTHLKIVHKNLHKKPAIKWLDDIAKVSRLYLALAITSGSLNGILLLLQAWLLAHIVSRILFAHTAPAQLSFQLLALTGIFLLRGLLAWSRSRSAFKAGLKIKTWVRALLLKHIRALGPAWVTRQQPGALANVLVDGVETLQNYYSSYIPQTWLSIIVPLSIAIAIFPIDWLSGLILAGTAPLIPVFMILIGKGADTLNRQQWSRLTRMSANFHETLSGLATLKAFGASKAEEKVVGRLSEDYRKSTVSVLRVAFLSSLALEFLTTISIAMVAVLIGFRLFWGELKFADGLTVLLLAPEFYMPLRKLGQAYHSRLAAVASAEDMVKILKTRPPVRTGRHPFAAKGAFTISLESVSFGYSATQEILHDVSLTLEAGKQTALVGPSGAGKSTLIYLLLGFSVPTSGQIKVDGIPLSSLRLEDWKDHLTWIPQRPHLFSGTVADNISLGRKTATRREIIKAAAQAQADQFIRALPQGYDTKLSESRTELSGGEIQRLAIARAFLRQTPFIVLDEPTASLDLESEAAVAIAIAELSAGKTVLTVAHRIQTVHHADHIIVLSNGRIDRQGSHHFLRQSSAIYRDLVNSSLPAGSGS